MKNNYLISPNYLLQLENDELRERIKKLISDFKELKKLYDEKNSGAAKEMVQNSGEDAIIQE
jgi:regulator of replication initiation timing